MIVDAVDAHLRRGMWQLRRLDPEARLSVNDSYSVCKFFADGRYSWVERFVPAPRAVTSALRCAATAEPAVVRVIIVDGGDCINLEWKRGEGVVFPPPGVKS